MKNYLFYTLLSIILLLSGCQKKPQIPESIYTKTTFSSLPNWQNQNHQKELEFFVQDCKNTKTKAIYKELCDKAELADDAKSFFTQNFTPYLVKNNITKENDGLLTGYYEPTLKGSLSKKTPYIYPIYSTPKDLIIVDLGSQYEELKKYRLRGKLNGNRLVPYDDRANIDKNGVDAKIICYVDSQIDLFFLEVQGSGVVKLDDGSSIYIGYENQNGHKYSSIGKYLIEKNELKSSNVSMQSIKEWLLKNPKRANEVLHQNRSKVFFTQKNTPAIGAMGVVLTSNRSIAVDSEFINLGSLLYISARDDNFAKDTIVVAQDRGGAIKGSNRADLFLDDEALAGRLKARLNMFLLLPNGVNP